MNIETLDNAYVLVVTCDDKLQTFEGLSSAACAKADVIIVNGRVIKNRAGENTVAAERRLGITPGTAWPVNPQGDITQLKGDR